MESRGVRVEDEPAYPREREYLLLARVLLANKAPDRALGLLERLAARAQAEGRNESVVAARLLQALAFHSTGDPVRAVRALESALGLAEPGAYIRLFVDEGEPMRALLSNISGEHRRYAEKLLAAFVSEPKTEGPTSSHVRGSLIEPLSERELEILSLLAGGLTNREIAERLVLSVGTVKVHLKHIYGKLDAHSRTQAIVRARGLNLL
jgi:LuxR family maltose regulon positive regulatory protein